MAVGLSPGDFVLDGDPPCPQKGGWAPQFSAHVYCGQMDGCIKIHDIEVGLSPGDFVLDRALAPFVSDIAIFVLKRDVKLQLTN